MQTHKVVAWGPYSKPLPDDVLRARHSYGSTMSTVQLDKSRNFSTIFRADLEKQASRSAKRKELAEKLAETHHRHQLEELARREKALLAERSLRRAQVCKMHAEISRDHSFCLGSSRHSFAIRMPSSPARLPLPGRAPRHLLLCHPSSSRTGATLMGAQLNVTRGIVSSLPVQAPCSV